jgi:RHS repeat-associated protein
MITKHSQSSSVEVALPPINRTLWGRHTSACGTLALLVLLSLELFTWSAFGVSKVVDFHVWSCNPVAGINYSFNGASVQSGSACDGRGPSLITEMAEGVAYYGAITTTSAGTITRIVISPAATGCDDIYVNGIKTTYFDTGTISTTAYGFSIILVPRDILFTWDKPKQDGHYRLVADGQSHATPSRTDTSVTGVSWGFVDPSHSLGCTIDSATGVLTASTNTGTVNVSMNGTDSGNNPICYREPIDLVAPNCDACSSGNCAATAGGVSAGLAATAAGIDVQIGLGWAIDGDTAGYLGIHQDAPSTSLATPQMLNNSFIHDGVQIISSGGVVQQVLAPDGLADVVTDTPNKYHIQFFALSNVTYQADSSSRYGTNGTPFAVVTIENPVGDTNQLKVTQTWQGTDTVYNYFWLTNGWRLTNGGGLRVESKTTTWSQGNTVRTVLDTIQGLAGTVYQSSQSFQSNSFGERMIQETFGSGQNALTNSYAWTNAYVLQAVHTDGSWEYYVYDSSNRPTNIFRGFTNQSVTQDKSLCRMTENSYTNVDVSSGDNTNLDSTIPRTSIEWLLGHEIGRSYFVALPGERHHIRCVSPGAAWNDANNLVTVTKLFTNGFYQNEIQSVLRPDGTIDIHQYDAINVSTNTTTRTNIVLTGHPDSTGTNIDQGTKTATVVDSFGNVLSRTVSDVASGITISSESYQYDGFKRLTNTTYLGGMSFQTTYDCCSISSTTDRDGTVTSFTSDALKRLLTSTLAGVTVSNVYDAYGNVLNQVRYGSSGPSVTLFTATFDDAGRTTTFKDALNNSTSYTNYMDSNGQTMTTATYPDNSTRTDTQFRDGAQGSVTGTAVHQVRYEYGPAQDNSIYRAYSKEIKLKSDGSDSSEWQTNYLDGVGRSYKTLYAAAQAPFPFRQSSYNSQGQLVEDQDPDNVTTLYQYNNKGEREYTATSSTQGSAIDFSNDRITRTIRDVTTISGTNVLRAQTYAWVTNSSTVSNLVAEARVSTDGLRSWDIRFGLTNQAATFYGGNGYLIVTNTAPDGSFTITTNYQKRLTSLTRKDSGGNQIGQTTYTYDAQGRAYAVTDARNGTTTYGFNNADQITSATTPPPGSGQSQQTTSFNYDALGRMTNSVLPDGGSVTNELYLTGELRKSTGTRTYPAGYSYDYQGRLQTMTNWTSLATLAGSRVTTWNYDTNRGFLLSKAYPDSQGPSYTYTPAGRLKTRVWARGITTTYNTNALGDVVGLTYSDNVTSNVVFTLDRLGRPTTAVDASGTHILAYLDSGLLLSETNSSGLLAGLGLTNAYDAFLRRSILAFNTNSSSPALTNIYAYDAASRLSSVSDGTYAAAYGYLANSPLVNTVTFKQNSTTRMTTTKRYDFLNRLQWISSDGAGTLSAAYKYNNANQRTENTQPDSSFWLYQYDSLGQVTSGKKYWSDWTPVAGQQFEYVFDDIGNRSSTKAGGDGTGANLRSASYSANNLNQYTSRDVPGTVDIIGVANAAGTATVNGQSTYRKVEYYQKALAIANSTTNVWQSVTNQGVLSGTTNTTIGNIYLPKTQEMFAYDADGNLTNDGRWMFTWDAENRPISMLSSNVVDGAKKKLDFVYDWRGRRRSKVVSTWSGSAFNPTATNRFVYDDWNLIAELDPTNNLIRSYVWGLDLSATMWEAGGVGGLLAVNIATNGVHFAVYDSAGNVSALVSGTNGAISAQYEYGAFGELTRASGVAANSNPCRFSTKFTDDESDFLYQGYRYYNPSMGRWLNRDPIEEWGGINLYSYVGNDSVEGLDPLGLWRYYGNWGGPDWTGGQVGDWNSINHSKALPPKDKQDSCYMVHDKCYGKCRRKKQNTCQEFADVKGTGPASRRAEAVCFTDCDRALSNCLKGLGTDQSNDWHAKIGGYYFAHSHPSAEK